MKFKRQLRSCTTFDIIKKKAEQNSVGFERVIIWLKNVMLQSPLDRNWIRSKSRNHLVNKL